MACSRSRSPRAATPSSSRASRSISRRASSPTSAPRASRSARCSSRSSSARRRSIASSSSRRSSRSSTRPLHRHEYLVGKYLGTLLTLARVRRARRRARARDPRRRDGRFAPARCWARPAGLFAVLGLLLWRFKHARVQLVVPWSLVLFATMASSPRPRGRIGSSSSRRACSRSARSRSSRPSRRSSRRSRRRSSRPSSRSASSSSAARPTRSRTSPRGQVGAAHEDRRVRPRARRPEPPDLRPRAPDPARAKSRTFRRGPSWRRPPANRSPIRS